MAVVASGLKLALLFSLLAPAALDGQAPSDPRFVPELRLVVEHPEPRPDVSADRVLPQSDFASFPIAQSYVLARAIPEVLDGLYSYCQSGRSLLSCFESEAAAECPVCLRMVHRAYVLQQSGESLGYIRRWHLARIPEVDRAPWNQTQTDTASSG